MCSIRKAAEWRHAQFDGSALRRLLWTHVTGELHQPHPPFGLHAQWVKPWPWTTSFSQFNDNMCWSTEIFKNLSDGKTMNLREPEVGKHSLTESPDWLDVIMDTKFSVSVFSGFIFPCTRKETRRTDWWITISKICCICLWIQFFCFFTRLLFYLLMWIKPKE